MGVRRGRRSAPPPAPLPQRHGIDPVRVRLPPDPDGRWSTIAAHLLDRFGRYAGPAEFERMLRAGRFVTVDGPIGGHSPYVPGTHVWFHRDFAAEEPVPFELGVVHRDEHVLVVDKPHFLATTPRGSHVTETALARLRRELDLPELQPAHRLDRLTAGLLLFVLRPADRGAYQSLFQRRRVHKEYLAVARHLPSLDLPRTVRSRIEKLPGRLAARELPGEPNSESHVELLTARHGLAGYRLLPTTGRTHQLRLHMSSLGLPLLYDPLYPEDPASDSGAPTLATDPEEPRRPAEDYQRPLQLLSHALEFTDPFTGEWVRYTSRLELDHWPGER